MEIFKIPEGHQYKFPKVERINDKKKQKKHHEEEEEKNKKKKKALDNIFENLAENLSHHNE